MTANVSYQRNVVATNDHTANQQVKSVSPTDIYVNKNTNNSNIKLSINIRAD